jgi:hypothetical protein
MTGCQADQWIDNRGIGHSRTSSSRTPRGNVSRDHLLAEHSERFQFPGTAFLRRQGSHHGGSCISTAVDHRSPDYVPLMGSAATSPPMINSVIKPAASPAPLRRGRASGRTSQQRGFVETIEAVAGTSGAAATEFNGPTLIKIPAVTIKLAIMTRTLIPTRR